MTQSANDWYAQGLAFRNAGNASQAVTCFNQALMQQPDSKDACRALAVTLQETGQFGLAIKIYEHLLKIEQSIAIAKTPPITTANAKQAEVLFYTGAQLQKNGEHQKAADAFRQMLILAPDTPEALANLGMSLYHLGQQQQAQETLLHALRVKPGFAPALTILGGSYGMSGQPLLAIACWYQVVAHEPKHFDAWANIAKEMSRLELLDESIKAYEQALAIRPDDHEILPGLLHLLSRLGRWERAEEIKAQLLASDAAGKSAEPFFLCVHLPQLNLENARRYTQKTFPLARAYDPKHPLPAEARADGKLRIGYLSADFYEHATAFLIAEMFEHHDRARFEIYAYSHGMKDASKTQSRLQNAADQFHEIHTLTDSEASTLIAGHGIDILVDLKGYTRSQRLGIMSQRPAPIQIHYLGYPGSMGAPFLDYYVTDTVCSPEGSDADFAEALIRLPHSYQINDRSRPLPTQTLPRTAYGLPETGFVFCDFNNSYKITPDVFSVWMKLLKQVEGSVLWLYETYPEATLHMRQAAQKHGIDPARIITCTKAPLADHLARYRCADLFLDTAPCGGHTTVSDTLWCGVPVITLAGDHFVSRVAASLVHAAEIPELAVRSLAEYETLALALARDAQGLESLKARLEANRLSCPLFDSLATTRAIESAYLEAADCHRRGAAPQAFNA